MLFGRFGKTLLDMSINCLNLKIKNLNNSYYDMIRSAWIDFGLSEENMDELDVLHGTMLTYHKH